MNKRFLFPVSFLFSILIIGQIPSCVHEPIRPADIAPGDSTLIPVDTTNTSQNPCDPDSVYFEREILPILISNCAKSGCHNESSAEDGVILNTYQNVFETGKIKPGDPRGSDVYEVITEDDPDKIMPPSSNPPLSLEQKELIRKWIQQGAQNLTCTDSSSNIPCDTLNISYSQELVPVINTHCVACHRGTSPSGGINLSSHAGLAQVANSGKLYGALAHLPGYSPMPQGTSALPACTVEKFKAWVNQGALNN